MRRRALLLAAAASLGAAGLARAADVPETVAAAYRSFLEGKLEDAASGFRYLSTLGVGQPPPEPNLALLARDVGRHDEALPLWIKASLFEGADGFVWNQRGWAYLALDRDQEARESFLKAIDRSSTTATQAEANLGLGLAALRRAQPKAALAALRAALVQGPYALSAASYQTALAALADGDRSMALAYLRQSVELDAANLEALRELARLTERVGDTRAAWRLTHRIASLDPGDAQARARLAKLRGFIIGDPQSSLPLRRLARPLLDPTAKGPAEALASSPTIRVGLFSGPDERAATISRAYLIVNTEFKLVAANGEVIKDDGRPYEQWQIEFRPDTNLVEVRDAARNIQYTAKQPFRFVPWDATAKSVPRSGSVLIKSVSLPDAVGIDAGDRELRGTIEVSPTPYGFRLLNELPLEDYLFGALGASLPPGSPLEAYKALAVVARTQALWHKAMDPPNTERAEICDSASCLRYVGISEEMRDGTRAAADTEGLVLTLEGKLARVLQHDNCGGVTEEGRETGEASLRALESVHDSAVPAPRPRTPAEFERWLHDFPRRDQFCEAGNAPQTHSRWIRFIDARALRERLDRAHPIGAVRHLRVVRRTATGRIAALEVEGSRGAHRVEGAAAIGELLSPGTLRSTLFSISPLMDGAQARGFVLWGAGTGHGLGLCKAGAVGQASLGRDWRAIVATYFPKLAIESLHPKPARGEAAARAPERSARTGHRKPKNPKRRKR